MPTRYLPIVLLFGSLMAGAVGAQQPASVDFDRNIRPILFGRCASCHGSHEPESGLSLTSREAAITKLESDTVAVVPHQPQASELLLRVTSDDADLRMPPKGEALTKREIQLLRDWIADGAKWPKHWAYRPLAKPTLPANSATRTWGNNAIDAFVLAGLAARQLRPSPPAAKRTLLRRVYFDLIGLPPTAEEFEAFEGDDSADSYEKVVQRLLDSPHYGERWARHWIDLVHFAESHGHDQDRPRENAWPYRDYLINSFNNDKPYARFVEEQVAGDVLYPNDPQAIIATGFLAAGPWDESSLRDIQADSIDRLIGQYLDRDDIVATTLSTFASTTVHCARCHDHKFDPISQREYYALQAVFAGIDKAERVFEPDTGVAKKRVELAEQIRRADAGELTSEELFAAELTAEIAKWEAQEVENAWRALEIVDVQSAEGAKLARLEDGSILSGEKRPEKDVYTVRIQLPAKQRVAALRVDVLPHASLPKTGPGREENGNFHLNEIEAAILAEDGKEQPLAWASARADFEQTDWGVSAAIDGKDETAWAIFPQVGKPHWAVFVPQKAIQPDHENTLVVRLKQVQGFGRLIGRFQLHAAATASVTADPMPVEIAEVIRVPQQERSEDQRRRLATYYLQRHWQRQLESLPPPARLYCGTNQFQADGTFTPSATPRMVHVLDRGNVKSPLKEAKPGALECIETLPAQFELADPANEGSRRAALAKWLASSENPLIWRSIANRVWQHHFGRGLVDTPNDFGRLGSPPSHPELLDWLAATLQEQNGSLKSLHRLIVTSATYQQAAQYDSPQSQMDADNRYLWRMNRRRLDAESIRDALLLLSGKLDRTMGGPSVRHFVMTRGKHVTPNADYLAVDLDHPGLMRRSIYRFLFRTLPDPYMSALDCPEGSQLTPRRTESHTAAQALALSNDRLNVRLCQHLAARVESEANSTDDIVIGLYRRVLGRQPGNEELQSMRKYVEQHGAANACRVLVNTNEFVFVE